MFLSKAKIKYCVDQSLKFIKESESYIFNKLSFSTTFEFKKGYDEVSIKITNDTNLIEEFSFKKNGNTIKIDSKNLEEFKKDISKACSDKISDLEDKRFLKMFPEYDVSLDRDFKLDELLKEKEEKVKENKVEQLVTTNEEEKVKENKVEQLVTTNEEEKSIWKPWTW